MTIHQFPLDVARTCDVEDAPYVRVYTPTTPSAMLLIRAIYWAKHLAVALLAITASIALGCGFGALAIWMNS